MTSPAKHPYPSVVFLCGPDAALATESAFALTEAWPATQAHSFKTPLFEGMRGTFFEGDPSIQLNTILEKRIRENNARTYKDFLSQYEHFLRGFFGTGEQVLASLLIERIGENLDWFSTFVIDDATSPRDMRMVADVFGAETCLIVNLPGSDHISNDLKVLNIEDIVDSEAVVESIEAFRKAVFA